MRVFPRQSRRRTVLALLGASVLVAAALVGWQLVLAAQPASASGFEGRLAEPAGAGNGQVASKVDHTCTTSENPVAGSRIELISEVTAKEALEGVHVEFEIVNTSRGLSKKSTAPDEHPDMGIGEERDFIAELRTILYPGDGWILKCTVKANHPNVPFSNVKVSGTEVSTFEVGALVLNNRQAWLESCGTAERFSPGQSVSIGARGRATGNTFLEKNRYRLESHIYKGGERKSDFSWRRTSATVDNELVFNVSATAPESAGKYTLDCVLVSKNDHLDLFERIKNVQSCQSGHYVPAVAVCMATLSLDVRVFWKPVWIISSTFCVGDKTDCPGTSTDPGTTTTTPPPDEEASPDPAPVTPVPVPAPPPAPPAPPPPSSSDRAALTALYNDTGGPRWINNLQDEEPWQIDVSNSDIDDWYGVRTHDNGRVRYLLLDFDNNLHGTLPSRLGNLTETLVLSIKGNERDGRSLRGVHGSIPGELGNLTALQELYLANNELSGAIPDALGNLSELDTLDLSNNRLTGTIPPALGNLANLRDIDLSGNRLGGEIPAALANLTDLESLYLSGGSNDFTGCIPSGLRRVDDHDLDELGIPFCDVALVGLTVSPGQLDEPFDSARTSFDATVYQSRITVVPTAVERGSFEILDDDNDLLADADTAASGYQVDLATVEETIQVRLVSSDGRQRRPYTLNLTVEGPSAPGAPTIGAITAQGASLLVPWSAASGSAASAPTSYNLRHIRSDATDKADANWTVSTISASPDSSTTSYWLQDLEEEISYDVQAQAVNDAGASPWSASVTATTGAAVSVSWISCSPVRPVTGAALTCSLTVTGGVRSDNSYAWWAPGSSTETGNTESFTTSWNSTGAKTVAVEVCSAGHCAGKERRVVVVDPDPNLVWRYTRPPAEIALGDSIDLPFDIIKLSWVGGPGGMSVSFPGLSDRNTGGDTSSYQSRQGTVETVRYTGSNQQVVYHDSGGDTLENADGTRSRPQHLVIATDNSRRPVSWFGPSRRTLRLKATPLQAGEFRILYRFWLCTNDRMNCARRPLQDGENTPATDQQGRAAFEFKVNVVRMPVIESVGCATSPVEIGDAVTCSPILSGSPPATFAWNAGNALAGGSPFEGSDSTFSTTWGYVGRHRVSLEVCNVAGCDDAEQFVTVSPGVTTETVAPGPVTLPGALTTDDGGRVLYSGPASSKAHSRYTPTDTMLQVKALPTSPVPTLQITIYDEDGFGAGIASYVSPGVVVLALPRDAWVDYARIATEMRVSGSWAPYTEQAEAVLLAMQHALSAAYQSAPTALGLAPAVGMAPGPALTASDHLALGLGGVSDPPVSEVFREVHANCVAQVTVPWLAWAGQTQGVRVSVPLSISADAYVSLAAAFTAVEPGATGGGEPALAQLHDLLDTGADAPTCQSPQPLTPEQ